MLSSLDEYKELAAILVYRISIALFIAVGVRMAPAQTLSFTSPVQLVDNVANQGSPTIIVFQSQAVMYYVNHNDNTIYVDFGLSGNPQPTGIQVESAYLTDVGAATIANGSEVLISYVNTNSQAAFALSSNGLNFGSPAFPSPGALGLPSAVNINPELVPALTSNGTTAYIATVGSDQRVYTSYTTDGVNYTPLIGSGISVSSQETISRPSLAMYNGVPYVAFTENVNRYAVVGPATSDSIGIVLSGNRWGQSNRTYYAGIALVSFNGYLYAFGQDTSASQNLRYMYFNGSGWAGTNTLSPNIQMRWTPSLTVLGSSVYLVYQDDANTNISYQHT